MIYLLFGNDIALIDQKLKQIKKNYQDINFFDANTNDFDINYVINCLNSNSLFSNSTLNIIYDYKPLSKKVKEDEISSILNYIENPSESNDLLFYVVNNDVNKTLKFYKSLIKNSQVFELNHLNEYNFNDTCKSFANKIELKIDSKCLNYLIDKCVLNLSLFIMNANLLKLYNDSITIEVIDNLCTNEIEDDIFKLVNAIISKNKFNAIKLYREIIKNSDILGLISLIVNQLRFIYQVKYLNNNNYSNIEISKLLKCSDKRIYMTLKNNSFYDLKNILELINSLYNFIINTRYKLNQLNINNLFELWIQKL